MRTTFRALTWVVLALAAAALYNVVRSITLRLPLWLLASELCILAGAIFIALATYAISRYGPPAPGRFIWTGMGLLVASQVVSNLLR